MLFTRFTSFLSITLLTNVVSAAFDATSNKNVALYWGQNAGGDQGRLSDYCLSNSADIIILSFLNDFPQLGLNFANQCGTTFPNSTLLHCPNIGADIKYCQSQGKKVLLSLGGAVGTYGFTSDSEATKFASTLWNKFGAGTADSQRPFDDAIVDGFDLDLENKDPTGFVALANALKSIYSVNSGKYYLSASPQCPFPDASSGQVLAESQVDFAFIQFYNNPCSLDKEFNWDTWTSFATSVAANKNIKLFLGVSGTPAIAGYVSPSVIAAQLALIQSGANFGGISIWDASFAVKNIQSNGLNFLQNIRVIIDAYVVPTSSSIATSASATSAPVTSASATSAPVTSASATSAPVTSAPVTSAPAATDAPSTVVVSNIATTVITVTSCSDHKCTAKPVTTGVVVVTENDTIYTTYCPLPTSTVTVSDISTTVVTITSCADDKCTEVPVTTGVTVVTLLNTVYTTYCPLSESTTAEVSTAVETPVVSAVSSTEAPVSTVTSTVAPVSTVSPTEAPVVVASSAPYPTTITTITLEITSSIPYPTSAPTVSGVEGNSTTLAPVVTTFSAAAAGNSAQYALAIVACGLAMLI